MRAFQMGQQYIRPETTTGLGTQPSFWFGIKDDADEETLRRFCVQKLRARLEISRIEGAALMEEIESPLSTVTEKRTAFQRWQEVTNEGATLEFALELIRRSERECRTETIACLLA